MSFAQGTAIELEKKPIQFGMPICQPFYHFRDGNWIPVVGGQRDVIRQQLQSAS